MKNSILMLLLALLMLNAHAFAQPLYVDLSTLLDADVFLEADGTPIGDPLDEEDSRIDAETLPENYQDGSPVTTQDGRTSFLFAPLKQSGLDAAALSGQTVDVEDGNYQYLDLALLAAPGAFNDPFPTIDFLYADGTSQSERLGPVAGWFQSPTAYDNIFYSYTDDSGVNSIISLDTFTDEELFYVTQESGNGNDNGNRFVDGNGYVLYWFDDMQGLQEANLGVTVGNNFVISIATEYYDPEFSTTEGYEVLANSMEIHDGVEHMALGNLRNTPLISLPILPVVRMKSTCSLPTPPLKTAGVRILRISEFIRVRHGRLNRLWLRILIPVRRKCTRCSRPTVAKRNNRICTITGGPVPPVDNIVLLMEVVQLPIVSIFLMMWMMPDSWWIWQITLWFLSPGRQTRCATQA